MIAILASLCTVNSITNNKTSLGGYVPVHGRVHSTAGRSMLNMKRSQCTRCENRICDRGKKTLCIKHYRFFQMRHTAGSYGKTVPSWEHLEETCPANMKCQDCGCSMNWRRADGNKTCATLQHYRDGTMAIVCWSCNSRHRAMPGDTYRQLPPNHKYCPSCKMVKMADDFYRSRAKETVMGLTTYCKPCSDDRTYKWRSENMAKHASYNRRYHNR